MKIDEAKQYISFNIKEGVWDAQMFEGWSDKDLIDFADEQMAKADFYANDNENEQQED